MSSMLMRLISGAKLLFFAVNPMYLRAIEYLTSLADGTCADGAALPALSWHSQDSVPGLALPIVPLGLQGALLPAVPFTSAWKR